MKLPALIILILLSFSCNSLNYKNKPEDQSDANVNEWQESKHPNLVPMYGNKVKGSEEKAADKEYVDAMLKLNRGDTMKAARSAARDGWYYFFHKKIDTAMFRFNQSWLIDSTFPASYFGFAAIKDYQGIKSEAEKYFTLGYLHDHTDSLTKLYLNTIATIKEEQKDTPGIISAYCRLLSRFPEDGSASGKLGFFYSVLNQPDSAMKYYNITIKFEPDYDQTYINRGWMYFKQGKIQEALNDYSTAIDKNNNSISALYNRANVYISIKRYKDAIADLQQCIKLDPAYPAFNTSLAECYFLLNEKAKGCEELDNAIRKGDNKAIEMKKNRCN